MYKAFIFTKPKKISLFLKKMMQQAELLEAMRPYNSVDFSFDGVELYGFDMYKDAGNFDFSSFFLSKPEYSSEISTPDQYFSSGLSDDCSHEYQEFGNFLPNLVESSISSSKKKGVLDKVSCLSDLMEMEIEKSDSLPSSEMILGQNMDFSVEIPSAQLSLHFPQENMELDIQLSFCNLIKAYGEAVENGQQHLVEALVARFEEIADPTGETFQRLAYYFVQSLGKNMDYLSQESFKVYRPAFLAFYQIFPFGRFAHFLANSEILNATPQDAEVILVDFDIGEGLQWPPLIEFLGRRKYRCRVRLITVRWEEDRCNFSLCVSKFEETKRHLSEYASSFNLRLEIEEIGMKELAKEMKMIKKNDWVAFNCMVNLPHMGRSRRRKQVFEFLNIAKESIKNRGSTNGGIITFGDGAMEGDNTDCNDLGSFLEGKMIHFHALLESMDFQFPLQLIEARIAMESLFVAPHLSSFSCLERCHENRNLGENGYFPIGLERRKLNKDGVAEAKELVGQRESQYWVRSEAENENEMVLGYMETPLVRFSSWK